MANSPHWRAPSLATRYLEMLLETRRGDATELIISAVDSGDLSVQEVYLGVFEPALREVGRLWQNGEISIAQEHFISATTQLIMSRLYPKIFASAPRGRWMVAACPGPELHEIGLRMVTDLFELGGWDTYYLGANLPVEAVLGAVDQRKAHLLALSATMPSHVSYVRELLQGLRADERLRSTTVLVGGSAFSADAELWCSVGADGFAVDAASAVTLAEQLHASKVSP